MFAVYCYEISYNIYIFDTEPEARVCYSLLEAICGYDNNLASVEVIFMDEFDTYEEIKNDQIELFKEMENNLTFYLIYKGETEAVHA